MCHERRTRSHLEYLTWEQSVVRNVEISTGKENIYVKSNDPLADGRSTRSRTAYLVFFLLKMERSDLSTVIPVALMTSEPVT